MDREDRNNGMEAAWADYQGRETGFGKWPNVMDYKAGYTAGWNDRGAANEWVRIVNVNELPDEGEYWVTTKDGHVVQNEFHSAPRFARPVPLHAVRAVMPFNRPAPYQPATNGSTEGE